jgi:hypothetical protein
MKNQPNRHILPVVAHGAEFLVQGYLTRRNILAYKAPPRNEGYDLICIHPDPHKKGRQIRVQVKSRYASDCSDSIQVKEKSFGAFDFLVVAYLNIGNFYNHQPCLAGRCAPEFYTFPVNFVKKHHDASGWEKFKLGSVKINEY